MTAGYTTTSSASSGGAGILLHARACDTAVSGRNWTSSILTADQDRVAGNVADTLDISNRGGSDGGDGEQDGDNRELHFEKIVCRWVWNERIVDTIKDWIKKTDRRKRIGIIWLR